MGELETQIWEEGRKLGATRIARNLLEIDPASEDIIRLALLRDFDEETTEDILRQAKASLS